ncbi:DUF3997 domain-containing protein [Pedobacter duraquae]|uniref:Uncharacterized protein DUF3997 n=1 Tax=Pedobacter duraquae TaxID=425511 RepID=A0A4R6IKA0_9SPHI|nr:DUF3997 domain-containing protein [Pedobacter duraquae]TDO22375.1 uncharacterized protein DUF3997 [Pedobacter duraquae]
MTKAILSLFIILLISSCGGIGAHRRVQIIGNYYLLAPDLDTEMAVSYKDTESSYSGIVSSMVFEIGHNKDYIIAKQHPNDLKKGIDSTVTNYYIIPIKQELKTFTDPKSLGPFDLAQFESKRKDLGITPIPFTSAFK